MTDDAPARGPERTPGRTRDALHDKFLAEMNVGDEFGEAFLAGFEAAITLVDFLWVLTPREDSEELKTVLDELREELTSLRERVR